MSVQTLLFFVLLTQVALIVITYRKERHLLDAINRAQSQNAKWLSDVNERLGREIRTRRSAAIDRELPERRYSESYDTERDRRWEHRSED